MNSIISNTPNSRLYNINIIINYIAPMKVLIQDLVYFETTDLGCIYRIDDLQLLLKTIHIQGHIVQVSGFSNEILIVDDGTSRAKVIIKGLHRRYWDWVNTGVYCFIVGTPIETGDLPVIVSNRLAKITNMVLKDMWPYEVEQSEAAMLERYSPPLTGSSDSEDNAEPD